MKREQGYSVLKMVFLFLFSCQHDQLQVCLEKEEPSLCMQERIKKSDDIAALETECKSIATEKWRGECYFLLSDVSRAIKAEGKRLCSLAQPFQEDCLRHVAARDVEQNLYPVLVNRNAKPMKVMPRIYGIVQEYLPAEIAQPMARDMLLRKYATEIKAPFTKASCQGMEPDMCSQFYIVCSLGGDQQWTGSEAWFAYCDQQISPELARSFSWLMFTADAQEIVQRSFEQICQAKPAAN